MATTQEERATALKVFDDYRDALFGCRFCPMCKPAGEVSNLTLLESYTTRGRAMLLWRAQNNMTTWTPRLVEIIYQSTLDSISEAWCVSHYPVSGYIAAARAELFGKGLAPAVVPDALRRKEAEVLASGSSETLYIAGETAEADESAAEGLIETAEQALRAAGIAAFPVRLPDGALPYVLGARDQARAELQALSAFIRTSGAMTVITDSPRTMWALTKLAHLLGVAVPQEARIVSLSGLLAEAAGTGSLTLPTHNGTKAFVHDSRAAAQIADFLPQAEAIQPGYAGDEAVFGQGAVYEAPRQLIDGMNLSRVYSVWQRALSKSSGADDGLERTYPALAGGLARQRLAEASRLGAHMVVTDSPLAALHLRAHAASAGWSATKIHWLPELLAVAESKER
jgi:hypothetical protein